MNHKNHTSRSTGQKKQNPPEKPENAPHLLDWAAGLTVRFDRFGWDILGIGLIAVSLLSLLGLARLTSGSFISPWALFLRRWLGWGSYVAVVFVGALGVQSLLRRFSRTPRVQLGRILALEGWLFTLLGLFSIIGGHNLDQADAGYDGGLIGWGIVQVFDALMPSALASAFVILLFVLFSLSAFGLVAPIKRILEKWLFAPLPVDPAIEPLPNKEDLIPHDLETISSSPGRVPDNASNMQPIVRSEQLPPLNLLMNESNLNPEEDNIQANGELLVRALAEFGIPSHVAGYRIGPVVTQFAIEPGYVEKIGPDGIPYRQKVRVSKITGLSKDLTRALAAQRLRIEAPVPGRSFIGIEVPNERISIVRLRPLLESEAFQQLNSPLSIVMGKDVSGQPVVADLARMPHLLIGGTTGSGKSVCIAAITLCLAMNNTPSNLRMVMLDPKMVELARFNGLPHLLGRVESEIDRMLAGLRWVLAEMDQRYRLMEEFRSRDIEVYNSRMLRRNRDPLPRIVLFIDELADLMMSAPDQTEPALVRLAQMARATGIHLVVATQRPSTDVITGVIKANFPTRISFTVASSVDSRVILDTNGAESLLGKGDLLYLNPEVSSPIRAQGVMVTDREISRTIAFWQKMVPPQDVPVPWEGLISEMEGEGQDKLIESAIDVVRKTQHASASLLQRRLRVGYPRAARLMDELEQMGIVGPSQGAGRDRDVLLPPEGDENTEAEDDANN